MELTLNIPQLDVLLVEIEDMKTILKDLLKSERQQVSATPVPGPETPEPGPETLETPAPAKRGRRRKVELINSTTTATTVVNGNGKVDDNHEADVADDDEATLRARVAFEAKRVQRSCSIGATRALLRKVTGADVLQVDDVPFLQLSTLLIELQAL